MATVLGHFEQEPLLVHTTPGLEMDDHDFFRFCQANRDLRIERNAKGDLIIMAPVSGGSSRANAELTADFIIWARRDGTGSVFDSSGGFVLPNGATRSPDVAWVRNGRLDVLEMDALEEFVRLCPDFVLELRSPSDSLRALRAKMTEYIQNGARLGWLIDPLEKRVHIYQRDAEPQILTEPSKISGNPVLKGFVLSLSRVWTAIRLKPKRRK